MVGKCHNSCWSPDPRSRTTPRCIPTAPQPTGLAGQVGLACSPMGSCQLLSFLQRVQTSGLRGLIGHDQSGRLYFSKDTTAVSSTAQALWPLTLSLFQSNCKTRFLPPGAPAGPGPASAILPECGHQFISLRRAQVREVILKLAAFALCCGLIRLS